MQIKSTDREQFILYQCFFLHYEIKILLRLLIIL